MKGALLTAALLLGSTQAAGVHKMKLKKIPLAEQLVSRHPCPVLRCNAQHANGGR